MMIYHVKRQMLKNQCQRRRVESFTEFEKVSIFLTIVSVVTLVLCKVL